MTYLLVYLAIFLLAVGAMTYWLSGVLFAEDFRTWASRASDKQFTTALVRYSIFAVLLCIGWVGAISWPPPFDELTELGRAIAINWQVGLSGHYFWLLFFSTLGSAIGLFWPLIFSSFFGWLFLKEIWRRKSKAISQQ
ncbi:MAG TPA: hypothetical protein VKT51_05865 [Candidatus Eremiobacteraceae bacterium]|nr:hypothetical protein [Candidatus Eremiobacteraceae bacterium]